MRISRDGILALLEEEGVEQERLIAAREKLPTDVDTVTDAGLLKELGVDIERLRERAAAPEPSAPRAARHEWDERDLGWDEKDLRG